MSTNTSSRDRLANNESVRELTARWVIMGELRLSTAALLGGENSGALVDMPVTVDRQGRPRLFGSSLAGALRNHVNDRLLGFGVAETKGSPAEALFGGTRSDDDGNQSPLIVFDSAGILPAGLHIEIRDGVAIDSATGTAGDTLKFDFEVIPAGTMFPIRCDVLVSANADEEHLLRTLAAALQGLETGGIRLGGRRSRGLGDCTVTQWRARRFDLTSASGWLEWIGSDHVDPIPLAQASPTIEAVLAGLAPSGGGGFLGDARERIVIDLELEIPGGLLVRSAGVTASAADASHLVSGGRPILPGTSLAGALRARTLRIANTVKGTDGPLWVERMFGPLKPQAPARHKPRASRLHTSESVLTGRESRATPQQLRVARIRVDRFTAGVVDSALFDEEPVFGSATSTRLELRAPRRGEVGLLLLVLKDLITENLPLGGATSVGRGVTHGIARLSLYSGTDDPKHWVLNPNRKADDETVTALNHYVSEFTAAGVESASAVVA